jgi:hypothetical protein
MQEIVAAGELHGGGGGGVASGGVQVFGASGGGGFFTHAGNDCRLDFCTGVTRRCQFCNMSCAPRVKSKNEKDVPTNVPPIAGLLVEMVVCIFQYRGRQTPFKKDLQ